MKNYGVYGGFKLSLIVALGLSAACAFSSASCLKLKEPGVLDVISYRYFEPISYGEGQGYEADLLKAIAKLWHVKIRFHPENIYEGVWRLPSRAYTQADIAIGGFTPAPYRKQEGASFSITTVRFKQSLLVRKKDYESGRIVSYQSFKNTPMKIGVVPGTTGEQYAHFRASKSGLPLYVFVQYESEAKLLPALKHQKIDAIARGEIGNDYQAMKNKDLVTIAKENFNEGFSFALDKSNRTLGVQVNDAIKKLTDNGRISYSQWMNDHRVFLKRIHETKPLVLC